MCLSFFVDIPARNQNSNRERAHSELSAELWRRRWRDIERATFEKCGTHGRSNSFRSQSNKPHRVKVRHTYTNLTIICYSPVDWFCFVFCNYFRFVFFSWFETFFRVQIPTAILTRWQKPLFCSFNSRNSLHDFSTSPPLFFCFLIQNNNLSIFRFCFSLALLDALLCFHLWTILCRASLIIFLFQ